MSIVDVSVDKPNMNQIFIEGEAVEISPVIVSQPDGEKDLGLHPVFIENKNTSLLHSGMVIHVVVKGDTLWHIAKRYINDPYKYPELARLSHIKNPDLIYPGDKVKIIYQNGSN